MKKFIIILMIAAMASVDMSFAASKSRDCVEVSGLELTQNKQEVNLVFTLTAGKRAARRDGSLSVVPVLKEGNSQAQFAPIEIYGNALRGASSGAAIRNGSTVTYSSSVPFESWMEGAALSFRGVTQSCGKTFTYTLGHMGSYLMVPEPVVTEVPEVKEPEKVQPDKVRVGSTADRLAELYPILAPVSDAPNSIAGNMPWGTGKSGGAMSDTELDAYMAANSGSSMHIHFNQGNALLLRDFADNNKTLVELVSLLRAIEKSDDSRVAGVVIVGSYSPEGSAAVNERLADLRGKTAKEFVLNNSSLSADAVNVYNGGIDWALLRKLTLESDMADKQAVVDIIDNTPIWDSKNKVGRLGTLMRLNRGTSYRYMLQNLFPKLRNAAYIKVYYENTNETNK